MKTKGYSPNVISLCDKVDKKYYDLLTDVSQYLYGKEFEDKPCVKQTTQDFKFKRKYQDKEDLENHITSECSNIFPR